jgi:long-chain acyl-CoA synthetase
MEKLVKTVLELYRSAAEECPDKKVFYFNKPDYKESLTYSQIWSLACEYSIELKNQGIKKTDSVGIWAKSSWRWEVSQLAVLLCQGIIVGIDLNEPINNYQKIEELVDLKFILFEDDYLIEKWNLNRKSEVKFLRMQNQCNSENTIARHSTNFGQPNSNDELANERPSFIFFTSGTTSTPKAIPYSDAKMIFAIEKLAGLYPEVIENPRTVCWLPLANLFQRMLNFSAVANRGEIFFIENPIDAISALATVNPDIFISVPRFYEKIYDTFKSKVDAAIFPLNALLKLGVKTLKIRWRYRNNLFLNQLLNILVLPMRLLVFNKFKLIFGKNLKILISGSAPLKKEILEFFHSLDLPIYEAYGTSENTLPIAANNAQNFRIGSVGRPVAEDSVKISADGEVFVKGAGVFSGYLKKNSEDCFENGYYKTGDLGFVDSDGFLFLIGRKTEMFKTGTGKKVATSDIEWCFKKLSFIDQVVVLGEGRKMPFVILTLDFSNLADFLKKPLEQLFDLETGQLYKGDVAKIEAAIQKVLAQSNLTLKPVGALLLTRKFSLEGQEITTNLKIKRSFLEKKFKNSIEKIYERVETHEEFPIQIVDSYDKEIYSKLVSTPFRRVLKIFSLIVKLFFQRFLFIFRIQNKEYHYRLVGKLLKEGLGGLKGPFHKLGQMLSLMPEHMPPEIVDELRQLFLDSQPINSNLIKAMVEKELKKPIPSVFLEWSDRPIATGSIGQVHWARLLDGQEVAVKVLIPQIKEMLKSDLKLLQWALPFLRFVLGFKNLSEHFEELKQLMNAEVNLAQEGNNYKIFKHIFKDFPDIIVPQVYSEFSSEKILVTEYIEAQRFDDFAATASLEEKIKAAEIIWFTSSYPINVFAIFNADPHPGNYLISKKNVAGEAQLKVVMVDFGFCKKWEKTFINQWKEQVLACCRFDRKLFAELSLNLGIRAKDSQAFFDQLFDINHEVIYKPWLNNEKFQFTEEWLKYYLQSMLKYQILVPDLHLPNQFLALSRLYWGKFNLMSKLGVEANFHILTMPYIEAKTLDLPEEISRLVVADE